MITIWKFQVPVTDIVSVQMPAGAEILTVQVQDGACVWAMVDTDAKKVTRTFRWRGTGHVAGGVGIYVGTVQLMSGELVFHLFVDREP
jgi:hypothetical protein